MKTEYGLAFSLHALAKRKIYIFRLFLYTILILYGQLASPEIRALHVREKKQLCTDDHGTMYHGRP